jgi:hypothetical protein
MDSWLNNALAAFERDNDGVVLTTRSLLARIVPQSSLHGRLINTLSLLEHLGSHKIMATQHSAGIDQATLKHVAEEAYHAYFMKRQAEKTAGRPLEYTATDLLAPAAARMYFQRLEAAMARTLAAQGSLSSTYLYMSLVIEFRALWFYRLYEQSLKRAAHPLSLRRVLGEERSHLEDVANRLEIAGEPSGARASAFLDVEKRLYGRLLEAMQRAVNVAAAA